MIKTKEDILFELLKTTIHVNDHGVKTWALDGLLHRLNGPAIKYPNGNCGYYIKGLSISKEEYTQAVAYYYVGVPWTPEFIPGG